MYRMKAGGYARTETAALLGELGHLNKYGRPITDAMIAGIDGNDAYRGVYRFGSVAVEDGIPRIVSDEEWIAAQHPRKRVKRRRYLHILPGMEFSGLTVVEQAETINHHTRWLCECKACGASKVEWATRLTSGRATHCGCRTVGQPHGSDGKFISRSMR